MVGLQRNNSVNSTRMKHNFLLKEEVSEGEQTSRDDVHYELARVVKHVASTNTLPDVIPLSNNLRTTVGSLPSNSVTLNHALLSRYVSRTHAEIGIVANGHYIEDKSSTHGTFVNGIRVISGVNGRRGLQHGDAVMFGHPEVCDSSTNEVKRNCYVYVYQKRMPPSPQTIIDEFTCSICMDIFCNPQSAVPCGHIHCKECIGTHLQTSTRGLCPQCNEELAFPFVVPCRVGEVINHVIPPSETHERRRKSSKTARTAFADTFVNPLLMSKGIFKLKRMKHRAHIH